MDLEIAIREHPRIGIPFLLCAVLAGCMLFAFVMQWNQYSMVEEQWRGAKEEWKKGTRLQTALRWYFLGSFIAVYRIWKESKGVRFLLPLSVAHGGLAWLLYKWMEHLMIPAAS